MNNDAVQDNINAYWDIRSESYDGSPGHGFGNQAVHDAWLAQLRLLLPPCPARILDVGTGTGFLALLAAELGYRSTGVDLSPMMLRVAESKAEGMPNRPVFQVGDAVAPPFAPESFEVVVSRHVLWTLRDPGLAFQNWKRLLAPGGTLLAIDGLWFQADRDSKRKAPPNPAAEAWKRYYSEELKSQLPLLGSRSFEPVLELLRGGAFSDCSVSSLDAISEVEKDQEAPRYAIVAKKRN